MSHTSPTAILLNIGHAMDHWIIVVFAYTWGVIAGTRIGYIHYLAVNALAFLCLGMIRLMLRRLTRPSSA